MLTTLNQDVGRGLFSSLRSQIRLLGTMWHSAAPEVDPQSYLLVVPFNQDAFDSGWPAIV